MITVAKFSRIEDAHLVASRIEAHGVETFISDEYVSGLYGAAFSDIQVQIMEEDAEQLRMLLQDDPEFNLKSTSIACPKCDSENIASKAAPDNFIGALVVLLTMIPYPATSRYQCNECNHIWHI